MESQFPVDGDDGVHRDSIETMYDNVGDLGDERVDQDGYEGDVVTQGGSDEVVLTAVSGRRRKLSDRYGIPLTVGVGVCGVALLALPRIWGRMRRRKRGAMRELVCCHVVDLTEPSVCDGNPSVVSKSISHRYMLGENEYTFVVSDRVNIAGFATHPGCMGGSDAHGVVCTVSAHTVDVLIKGGATCVGVVPTMSDVTRGKEYMGTVHETLCCGVADVGASVALRKGICTFALCVDDGGNTISSIIGGGLFGYRPTSGLVSVDGCSGCSPTLSSLCIAARDSNVFLKVSAALDVPKSQFQDDLERYLVAEDAFSVCSPDVKAILPSVIQGVKRWAGPDQAQALSLCQWIHHKIPAVGKLLPQKERENPSTDAILDALAAVVDTIHSTEVGKRERSAYADAIQIAEDLSIACRNAMQEGLVFVIPVCSSRPPAGHSVQAEDMENWERDCKRFASISALAGIPEVVLPIRLDDGSYLGIGILAMQRKDSVLLRAVGKIAQYIQEEQKWQVKPDQATTPAAEKKVENKVSMAEAEKSLGNACFKLKKYEQAIQHYSRAVQLDAKNPVYLSNRAMAYLKMGAYEEAEEDCTNALRIDPCLVKGLLRRGAARAATARFAEAKSDFERVLVLEPQNKQAKIELNNLASLMNHSV